MDAWGFVALVAALSLGLMVSNPSDYVLETRLLAVLVIAIGVAPLARWMFLTTRLGAPIFEIYMLFHAICFGFAGFMPQASTLTTRTAVTSEEWNAALVAVAVSLSCTSAGYYFSTRFWSVRADSKKWPFTFHPSLLSLAVPGMLLLVTPMYLYRKAIPLVLVQVVQSVALLWFLILVSAAFRKEIREPRRSLVIFGLIPLNVLLFSSFGDASLYGLFGILIPAGLARFQVSKRPPWALAGLVVLAFLMFQPIKSEYRVIAWGDNAGQSSAIVEFPSIAIAQFAAQREAGFTSWDWFAEAFRRLNHLHVTAAIIADTPTYVPYSRGETYLPLVTKLIPRALWPDKPIEDQGNAWAHRYGYLSGIDDVTSFNLPFLPEMYMNFGYPGIILIACLLGALMSFVATRLWMREGDCSQMAFGILVGLPFLTPESNLSLLLGRAAISAVAGYTSLFAMAVLLPQLRVGNAGMPRTTMTPPLTERARS